MASGLQSSILPMLYIPPANCEKKKLQTAKQLLHSITMLWTTKEIKMELQVLEG